MPDPLTVTPKYSSTFGNGGRLFAADSELYVNIHDYVPNTNGLDWVGVYPESVALGWDDTQPSFGQSLTWGYLCSSAGCNSGNPPSRSPEASYDAHKMTISLPGEGPAFTSGERYVALLLHNDEYVEVVRSYAFTIS